MSWLFKSLQSDDSGDGGDGGGVKDDLAVFTETFGRQLRGVSDFFAPPPETAARAAEEDHSSSSLQAIDGIRNDLAEIGDSFKNSISRISGTKAVSGISKFASSLLQFPYEGEDEAEGDSEEDDDDGDDDGVAGIDHETIEFVRKIADRPELWTEFPISVDKDFHMSDIQKEHASTIEDLVPSFSALRVELESYINSEQFWLIYFILLVPRLNEQDSQLLSSPKIIQTRDVLMQKLQSKENAQAEIPEDCEILDPSQERTDVNNPGSGEDIPSKEEEASSKRELTMERIDTEDEASDTQLKKTQNDARSSLSSHKNLENEEFSFSDLEDEDGNLSRKLSGLRLTRGSSASSPGESNEWVRLKDTEGEDSNEWCNVDDFE